VIAVYISAKAESRARQNPEMRGIGVPIPTLDPPWPDGVKIAVVTSRDVPQWRRFAHEVAAAAQPGGHSFPLAEPSSGRYGAEHARTAFLYRHADRACGYLCLASRLVTGYRSPSEGYRSATHAERIIRPCIMVVWVDVQLRRHGIARQLVDAAVRHAGVTPSGLVWAEPFTDRGYFLAPITYLAIENQFPGCWAMRAPASEYGTSSPLIGATVCPAQVVPDLLLLG
jgi:GNAT superfamily N-acetyltransferase